MNGAVSHSQFGMDFPSVWLQPTTAAFVIPAIHQYKSIWAHPTSTNRTIGGYQRRHTEHDCHHNQSICTNVVDTRGTNSAAFSDTTTNNTTQPNPCSSDYSSNSWADGVRTTLAVAATATHGVHTAATLRGTNTSHAALVRPSNQSSGRNRHTPGCISSTSPVYISTNSGTGTRGSVSNQWRFWVDLDFRCLTRAHACRWLRAKRRGIYCALRYNCSQTIRPTLNRWKEPM